MLTLKNFRKQSESGSVDTYHLIQKLKSQNAFKLNIMQRFQKKLRRFENELARMQTSKGSS